jgi:hypothetical protein
MAPPSGAGDGGGEVNNPYLSADLHNLATTWAMVAPKVDTLKLHRKIRDIFVQLCPKFGRDRPVVVTFCEEWVCPLSTSKSLSDTLWGRREHEVLTAIVSPNDTVTVVPASEALKVLRESEAEQQA